MTLFAASYNYGWYLCMHLYDVLFLPVFLIKLSLVVATILKQKIPRNVNLLLQWLLKSCSAYSNTSSCSVSVYYQNHTCTSKTIYT